MNKIFRFILISTIFITSLISAQVNVVPKPQHTIMMDGELQISNKLNIDSDERIKNEIIINQINNEFSTLFGDENFGEEIKINLQIFSEKEDFIAAFSNVNIEELSNLNYEGYILRISEDGIDIVAKTEKGIFYGVQTLKQILRSNRHEKSLPNCLILDYPEQWFRSISDDISRGPLPNMEFLKYQIRRASELKYNHWMHYVEHVVKTKKHGDFAPSDGSLNINEIKELSEYAKKYYITFFGNFQSFGHYKAIGSYPQYEHLVEMGTLISPVLEESYEFLEDIYTELVPAFNAPFFAVNCDETFDLGKGKSKKLVDSIGIAKVYTNHILRLKKILDKLNVKTIIWADEVLKYPGILDDLPKDIILGTWIYDAIDSFDEYIDPIAHKGFEFMFAPGILNSTRIIPNFNTALKNIRNFNRDGIKAGAMGMLNCVWDDGGFALFNHDWYGVAYGGEQSWNYNEDSVEDFNNRFNAGIYGDKSNTLTNTIFKLLELAELIPTDNMNQKILWTNTIPERFSEISISLDDWDQVKEISESASEILKQKENYLYNDDYAAFMFSAQLYEFLSDLRINIVLAADSYRTAMLNQDDKILCRASIKKAVNAINELLVKQNAIIYEYKRLWLIENKTYALDRLTDKMELQYQKIENLSKRLFESLKDFDKGLYLKPPNDVGLEIKKILGQYFRGWLMIDPLPLDNNAEVDYLKDMGGELEATPKVTNEFFYNGVKYRWKRVYSTSLDIINIKEFYPAAKDNCVSYAFAELSTEKNMKLVAEIGVDDGAIVFLNGKKVLDLGTKKYSVSDKTEFEINLKKGKNYLMIKILQTDGNWDFTFKLPNVKFKGSKNRYRIIE